MTVLDTRLIAYLIWGIGVVVVYGLLLRRRRRDWTVQRDSRSRRELYEAVAEFVTSLASCLAITFVLFGEAGTGIRGLMAATALGAYFAAGVVKVTDKP